MYLGYFSLFTIAPESFPTQVRSTGYGIVCIIGRIGGISGPIVSGFLLSETHRSFIVLCIIGASFCCSGLLILTQKETRKISQNKAIISYKKFKNCSNFYLVSNHQTA